MTHYRMQDGMPSAIILAKNPRTSSLDELRTYNENTIFLNNGNEFQIRLFNPLSEKIGVKIGLNEKYSESFLILNPGQDVTLDRFIDDQKKMLFETYSYESTNESAKKAIVNNGNVTIQFFKEKRVLPIFQSYGGQFLSLSGSTTNGIVYNTHTNGTQNTYLNLSGNVGMGNPNPNNTLTIDNLNNGTLNLTNININTSDYSEYLAENINKPINYSDYTNTTVTTNTINNSTYTSGVDMNLDFKSNQKTKSVRSKSLKKETGRVEKGTTSNQNLIKVEVEFETTNFYEVSYNLKPVSEKDDSSVKIREYCESCSYRIRNTKYNFCPKCGTKI